MVMVLVEVAMMVTVVVTVTVLQRNILITAMQSTAWSSQGVTL